MILIFTLLFLNLITIGFFLRYRLVPLRLLCPSRHHTVVRVHESVFLFAQSLHLKPPHSLAVILLSFCESVPIALVSTVCSLDFTYK